ncbi:hypothetical protein FA10DRAFT_299670 [Acaromyces ingoldii]|uniref:Uncharacterized protein n=1 Tax=Acaromyces ingoldii TaxID=215250 RepID=A0A316YYW8_9BASI|nr:hypothetical protein FA10DRAFT_299670 [Acaromyces ingoldii]PWN94391.1 hypothetical protein FA10DRAFT_299670 [Acaromyces ingoldii]
MSSRGGQHQVFDPFFAEVDTEAQSAEGFPYGQSRMVHAGQQPLLAQQQQQQQQQQPRPLHSVPPLPVDAWVAWDSNNGSTITGSYQYGDQEQLQNRKQTIRDEQLFAREPAESPTHAHYPSTNTSPIHLAFSTKQDGPSKGGIGSGHSWQNSPQRQHHQQEGQQQQGQLNDNKNKAYNHEGNDDRSVCSEDADGSSYAGTPPLEPQCDSKLIIVSDKKWSLTAAAAVTAPVAEDAHQEETEHHSLTDIDDKQDIDPLTQLALVATSGAMRPTLISSKGRAPARDSSSKKKKKRKMEKTVARIAPSNEPPMSSFVPQISATELLKDQDSEEDVEARSIRAELERKADLDFEQDMFERGQRERNRQPCIIEGVNEVMTPSKTPFGHLQATPNHMRMIYKGLVKEDPEGDKFVAEANSTSHGDSAYAIQEDNTSCCSNRESTAQNFLASQVQQRSAVDSRDTAKSTSGLEEANVPHQSSSQECFSFLTFDDTPNRINSGRCSDIKVFESLDRSPPSSPLISEEDVPEDVPEMALTPQTTSSGAEEKGCASRDEVEYGTRTAEREVCGTAEVDTRSEIATEEMLTTPPNFSQDTSSTAFSMQPRQFCDIATQTDPCACNGLVAGRIYSKENFEAQKGLASHLAPKHDGLSVASPYVCVPSDRASSEPIHTLSNVVPLDLTDVLSALPELVERRGPPMMHPPAAGSPEPAAQLLPSSSSSETDAMVVDAGLKVAELRFQLSATPPPTGSYSDGHCESMLPSPSLEKDFDTLLPKIEAVINPSSTGTAQAIMAPTNKEVARVMKRSVSGANKFHKVLAEMPEEDREVACMAMLADARDTSISLRRRESRQAEKLQQNGDESKNDAAVDNNKRSQTNSMPKSSQKCSKRAKVKDEEDDVVAETDGMSAKVAIGSAKMVSITDTNALSTAKDPTSMTKQTREGPVPTRRKRLTNLPPFQRNLRSRK